MQAVHHEKKRKGVDVSEARRNFADLVSKAGFGGERLVLSRNGKPVAALISFEALTFFEELEDQYDLKAAREVIKQSGKTYTSKQVKKMLGIP